MSTVEKYLQLGFRGIAIVTKDSKERVNGYRSEHIWHSIACFDIRTGEPLYVEIYWKIRHEPERIRVSHKVLNKKRLSQAEYEQVVEKHGVLDGPLYHQKECIRYYEKEKVRQEMDRLTPICPMCGNQMLMKFCEADNSSFWECGGYRNSRCNGRLKISPEERMKWDRFMLALQ